MNKITHIIVILNLAIYCILTFFSCVQPLNEKDIYGVWKGKYLKNDLLLKFSSDRTCLLSFTNNDSSSTMTLTGNFEINFSKKPIPLSIKNIPQLNHSLHTIIEFVEIDKIKLGYFSENWRNRPISFNMNESFILKRL